MPVKYESYGPFCCEGEGMNALIHDVRTSAAYLPDEKHEPIHQFIAAVNAGAIDYAINALSDYEAEEIKTIIKMNVLKKNKERATYYFAPTSDFSLHPTTDDKIKYIGFACYRKDNIQQFETTGSRAFLSFRCKNSLACKKNGLRFRVGIQTLKWNKNGTWAGWDDVQMDDRMGHPRAPFNPFGQEPIGTRRSYA